MTPMSRRNASLLSTATLVTLACLSTSCSPSLQIPGTADSSGFRPGSKCEVSGDQVTFRVVDLSAADGTGLETAAKRGIVFVRFKDCKMDVLTRCSPPARYGYTPATGKGEHVSIKDEGSLFANVPLGAAKLKAKLEATGQLDIDMTVAGEYYTNQRITTGNACPGAAHYVTSLTVGAFEFSAVPSTAAAASAKVMGAGAGAEAGRARERLSYDGNKASCGQSGPQDIRPPEDCGAPIQVTLATFDRDPVDAAQTTTSDATNVGSSQRTWGGVALGVGAAGFITGSVTSIMWVKKNSDLEFSCPDKTCDNQESDVNSINRLRTISLTGLIGGSVLMLTGVTLLSTAPDAPPKTGTGVRPWVGMGSVGLGGTFQ